MDIHELGEYSKLFIPVIALLGVYIAYQQHVLGKEKARFDFFEKRFSVYQAINKVVLEMQWNSDNLDPEDFVVFYQACNEAEFLLPDYAYAYIKGIRDAVRDQRMLVLKRQRRNLDENAVDALYDKEEELLERFDKYQKELSTVFRPYLKIGSL